MGQRLNIEILDNGETLANSYYHWSAYTGSAIELTKQILEQIDDLRRNNKLGWAVSLLECTGAGVNEEERMRIDSDKTHRFDGLAFNDAINRNEGLLSVTSEGIEETRTWEEGRVEIDISTRKIMFSVLFDMSESDYDENYREDGEEELPTILEKEMADFLEIPFDRFDEFSDFVDKYPHGVRLSDCVLMWIE